MVPFGECAEILLEYFNLDETLLAARQLTNLREKNLALCCIAYAFWKQENSNKSSNVLQTVEAGIAKKAVLRSIFREAHSNGKIPLAIDLCMHMQTEKDSYLLRLCRHVTDAGDLKQAEKIKEEISDTRLKEQATKYIQDHTPYSCAIL